MSDKQRTCGDCAWWQNDRSCNAPTCQATYEISYMDKDSKADDCETFRSHADKAIIDECHKLRSLGAAVEWQKIDRLVEIAAGRELDRVKRCVTCEGIGHSGVITLNENGNSARWVECKECHGTGYKKGGDERRMNKQE